MIKGTMIYSFKGKRNFIEKPKEENFRIDEKKFSMQKRKRFCGKY